MCAIDSATSPTPPLMRLDAMSYSLSSINCRPCMKCGAVNRDKRGNCKACAQEYRDRTREISREKKRISWQKNKAVHMASIIKWRKQNPEKYAETMRKSQEKYRLKNLEKVRERSRKSAKKKYQENPEKFKKRAKQQRTKHLPKVLQRYKEKYWSDPEASRKAARDWAKNNPEKVRTMHKKQRDELMPCYVRKLMCDRSILTSSDIPDNLILIKKAHMTLKRKMQSTL